MNNKNIFNGVIAGIAFLIVNVAIFGFLCIFNNSSIYNYIAISIIVSWLALLIGYYVWAIKFYNIQKGKTEAHNQALISMLNTGNATAEDLQNPHQEETLGLPAGTVRGTIALSLVVAGLSLCIATFGSNPLVPPGKVFVDNFEFIKNAFLMMIAFYFGAKSLEVLTTKNNSISNGNAENSAKDVPPPPMPPQDPNIIDDIAPSNAQTPNFNLPNAKE